MSALYHVLDSLNQSQVLRTVLVMFWSLLAFGLASLTVADPLSSCPGYAATNIQNTTNCLTATLTLAGDACNAYGDDIKDLQLLVEYQSSKTLDCIVRHTF